MNGMLSEILYMKTFYDTRNALVFDVASADSFALALRVLSWVLWSGQGIVTAYWVYYVLMLV